MMKGRYPPGWNLLTKEQQQEALKQDLSPIVKKAYLRMQLKNSAFVPGLLMNYSKEELAEYVAKIFLPSDDPVEEQIQQIADLLIPFIYPDKKIDQIIDMTFRHVEEAYNAILKHGGGWSRTSNPDKRKMAVLAWFRRNNSKPEYSLSSLKEIYLQDSALYDYGSGQERRNFINRLLINIIKTETNKKLTYQELDERINNIKKVTGQPLRLEDL